MANSNYQILYRQKRLVEREFTCFKCNIHGHGETLKCKGILQPLDNIEPYDIEIIQVPGISPKVYIKNPKIDYNSKIHMYKAGHLCLYYPTEFMWNTSTSIAHYTIPWINEWILYYEIYKITGIWEGVSASHSNEK